VLFCEKIAENAKNATFKYTSTVTKSSVGTYLKKQAQRFISKTTRPLPALNGRRKRCTGDLIAGLRTLDCPLQRPRGGAAPQLARRLKLVCGQPAALLTEMSSFETELPQYQGDQMSLPKKLPKM
jgi:hypothetical protein